MTIEQIAELIRTQDCRAAAHPVYLVQDRERIYGMSSDYSIDYAWISVGEFSEADEEEAARLDELDKRGEPDREWCKTYYIDRWQFVTACFTEKGCQDYINANRHNLTEPRIYAASAYRNEEFIAVREHLLSGARS